MYINHAHIHIRLFIVISVPHPTIIHPVSYLHFGLDSTQYVITRNAKVVDPHVLLRFYEYYIVVYYALSTLAFVVVQREAGQCEYMYIPR